jgi:hypothetical protein
MAAKLNNANLLFADDFDPEPQRPGYLRIKKMIERPFSHELASKVFSVELRAAAEMLRQVGAGLKTEEDFTVEEQGTLAFARSVLERVQVKDPEFKPKLDQLAIAFPDDANAYRLVNAWNQRRNYRRRQAMEIAKTNESMALYLSLLEADMDEATIFEAFPYLRAEIIELLPKESLERRYVADVKGVRPVKEAIISALLAAKGKSMDIQAIQKWISGHRGFTPTVPSVRTNCYHLRDSGHIILAEPGKFVIRKD